MQLNIGNEGELNVKVLMVVEQCNPLWPSVPLVAYRLYDEVSKLVDVTLVTHERNRAGIEPLRDGRKVHYISESGLLTKYFSIMSRLANRGSINWPLYHVVSYPIYASFNRKVYNIFGKDVLNGEYDLVHALTPMMPRYPVKLINACLDVPFVLGPVNGGVPFPKGFETTARKEFVHFNFLRNIGRYLIPGYRKTYTRARMVLAGSNYTKSMIEKYFNLHNETLVYFPENGIEGSFIPVERVFLNSRLKLLFVGRLVPYKGADMMIEAVSRLPKEYQAKIEITIVGDGPEKQNLVTQANQCDFENKVKFMGWIEQSQTVEFYKSADLFCFPSIREFGGAVVLEAMATGLPCLVVNNGGIGEYVNIENGFKVEPNSRLHIIDEISKILLDILEGRVDMKLKSELSGKRVKEFTWNVKGKKIHDIYKNILLKREINPK